MRESSLGCNRSAWLTVRSQSPWSPPRVDRKVIARSWCVLPGARRLSRHDSLRRQNQPSTGAAVARADRTEGHHRGVRLRWRTRFERGGPIGRAGNWNRHRRSRIAEGPLPTGHNAIEADVASVPLPSDCANAYSFEVLEPHGDGSVRSSDTMAGKGAAERKADTGMTMDRGGVRLTGRRSS
jgi:hypothetical protein